MLLLGQSHLASWLSCLDARLQFVNIPHFPFVLEMPLARCWRALIPSTRVLLRYGFVITKHGGYLRMVL